MIPFHSLHVAFKQDYLYSIHFHSFPFVYFKISNQGYLISFHFILFHLFPLLKYIPFLFILLWSFHSIPLWTPKRSLNDHVLLCSHALMITYFYVHMFWRLYTPHVQTLVIICYHIYKLWRSYAHMHVCPHAHMFGLFDDHMLTLCML